MIETTTVTDDATTVNRVATGVPGLESITGGGFLAGRSDMIRGESGAGKTLLGHHCLTAAGDDETTLFVNRDVSPMLTREGRNVTGEFERGLHQAIGILKKRTGDFGRTLRESEITNHGSTVGEPLSDLRGVLVGTPEWADDTGEREP